MDSARWSRIRELFEAAVEVPDGERAAWLDERCGDDDELKVEVLGLLEADLDAAATQHDFGGAIDASLRELGMPAEFDGARVGQFRIEELIGAGGMGMVYRAVQDRPARAVALKMIRTALSSPQSRRRFEYEAEILGSLHHPGIAQVFEAGTFDQGSRSLPYFAMELIEGARPLDEFVRVEELDFEATIRVFLLLCEAVQYGHQKGIVHRDLKPANVLVDASGQPKIIDFGIARITRSDDEDRSMATETGNVLGTLQYMSPEQLTAGSEPLDTRSDVYALGVILYELFAARLPYDIGDLPLPVAARAIVEREPERLSVAVRTNRRASVPLDLDWIVAKAMAKERERRYASASEFAADLHRLLRHEPVEAGPPSAAYLVSRFVRRHRTAVGAGTLVLLALIVALWVSTTAYFEADEARVELTELSQLQANILSGVHHSGRGRDVRLADLLDETVQELDADTSHRPQVRASLYTSIGVSYYGLGMIDEARDVLEKAVVLVDEHLPIDHPTALQVNNHLGSILGAAGEYERAESLMKAALRGRLLRFGEAHMDVANSRANLANLLMNQGRYTAAAYQLRLALHTIETVGRGAPRLTVITKDSLASCLEESEDPDEVAEARRLLEEAVDLAMEYLGPEHQNTLIVRANWAQVLALRGDVDGAIAELRDIVRIKSEIHGEGHVSTLLSRNDLAGLLRYAGKHDAALPILVDLRERMREGVVLPPAFAKQILRRLVATHDALGDEEAAEAARRELEGGR